MDPAFPFSCGSCQNSLYQILVDSENYRRLTANLLLAAFNE